MSDSHPENRIRDYETDCLNTLTDVTLYMLFFTVFKRLIHYFLSVFTIHVMYTSIVNFILTFFNKYIRMNFPVSKFFLW